MNLLEATPHFREVLEKCKGNMSVSYHDGVRKRIQGKDAITLHMSQGIQKLFGVIIPVESGSLQ